MVECLNSTDNNMENSRENSRENNNMENNMENNNIGNNMGGNSSLLTARRSPATTQTLSDVPLKDLVIVILILMLWLYSIWLIVRAWAKIHNLGVCLVKKSVFSEPGQYLGTNMWRLVVEYLQRKKRGTINEMMRIHRLSLTLHNSRKGSNGRRETNNEEPKTADNRDNTSNLAIDIEESANQEEVCCHANNAQVSPSVIVSLEPEPSDTEDEADAISPEFVSRLAADSIIIHVNEDNDKYNEEVEHQREGLNQELLL